MRTANGLLVLLSLSWFTACAGEQADDDGAATEDTTSGSGQDDGGPTTTTGPATTSTSGTTSAGTTATTGNTTSASSTTDDPSTSETTGDETSADDESDDDASSSETTGAPATACEAGCMVEFECQGTCQCDVSWRSFESCVTWCEDNLELAELEAGPLCRDAWAALSSCFATLTCEEFAEYHNPTMFPYPCVNESDALGFECMGQ